MKKQENDQKVYSVWVGESEQIASFHAVEGYRKETFANHDFLYSIFGNCRNGVFDFSSKINHRRMPMHT